MNCGWVNDEGDGDPEHGVAPETVWDDVPPDWSCPDCGARKSDFEWVEL
jgi:rubredoxin